MSQDAEPQRRLARAAAAMREANRKQGLVRAVRATRELLPGDENFGDELSTEQDKPSSVIARFLAEGGDDGSELSASREAALATLQVWQALSQRVGRGAGPVRTTILFTDLVGFSAWVLDVGDELALELLRKVAAVVEPAISAHRGRLVKRLGDGHMAVFGHPRAGIEAALEMQKGLAAVEVGGHHPKLRAGLHLGQPRQLGNDYLGTDVNIAARLSEAAGPGEVLISGALVPEVEDDQELEVKRRRWFRAKGAPRDLEVFSVARVT